MELSMNRLSWDELYTEIAKTVAKRSKDPHTQVGAVLVKNHCILGLGYNGEPINFKYNFDWHSYEKYLYVIHAEVNAIINATSIGADIRNSDIYLTLSPCPNCMKLLVQYQIKNIFFIDKYEKNFALSKHIADNANINLIQVNKTYK